MNKNPSLLAKTNVSNSENEDSSILPLYMDSFLCVTHLMCASVGFPLNFLVISFIVHSKRLHLPRNFAWLGVAFSNIVILLNRCIELCAVVLQNQLLCRIFIFMVGLPYATLLLNLFLALVDRFVSIVYASWYKRHVQICYIIAGQIIAVTLLIFVTKFSYIFRLISVDCHFNLTDAIEVSVVIHILIVLCIAGQITVYYKTKNVLLIASQNVNPQSDLTLSVFRCHHPNRETTEQGNFAVNVGVDLLANDEENHIRHNPNTQHNCQIYFNEEGNSFFVRVGNQTISRLEIEAARNLTAGILSLFLFSVPSIVFLVIRMSCVHFFNDAERCTALTWVLSYTSELILLFTIYHPIIFMVRSRDCTEALRKWFS